MKQPILLKSHKAAALRGHGFLVLLIAFYPLVIIEIQPPKLRYVVVFLIESAKKVPSVVDNRMALPRKGIELLASCLGPKSLPSFVVKLVDIQVKWVGL